MRPTKTMKDVASYYQMRPESLAFEIQRYINDEGYSLVKVAKEFGISKALLGYWIKKLKLEKVQLVLAPGEEVIIKSPGSFDPGSNVIVP